MAKAAQHVGLIFGQASQDGVGLDVNNVVTRWSKWKFTKRHDRDAHNLTNTNKLDELGDRKEESDDGGTYVTGVEAEGAGRGGRWLNTRSS